MKNLAKLPTSTSTFNHMRVVKDNKQVKSKSDMATKYRKMSSDALLNKIVKSNLSEEEAIIAATLLEKRFPTPPSLLK